MRAFKGGRSVRFRTLQFGAFALCLLVVFTANAAVADPPSAHISAPLSDTDRKKLLAERDRYSAESQRLESQGKTTEAIAAAEKMLAIERNVFGNINEQVVGSLQRLAQLHESREEFGPARQARDEVLAIRRKLYGEKDWRVTDVRLALEQTIRLAQLEAAQRRELARATSLSQEAERLSKKEQFGKASELAENVLAIRKKILGEMHPDFAATLNNLAWYYKSQGNYARAEPLYRRALQIDANVLGETHPDYASDLSDLAVLYKSQRDYAKAEPLYWQVLAIRKKALGETHPDYARSLNNLAVLYDTQGNYAKAEPLYRQALEIYKKAFGEMHPDYAASLNDLAWMYKSQGEYTKAEPLYRQALAIRKKALGETHPDYAASLNDLAWMYESHGEYAKAEPLYRQVLAIRKKVLGETHPDYAQSLNTLALLYKSQGNYVKAEPLYRQALAIRKKVLGETHPDYATSLNNLAVFYESQGNYVRAEPLHRQALAIRKKILGETHPDYATSLNNLAVFYKSQGDYAQAELLYRQALAIRKKAGGETTADYAIDLNNLAVLYVSQGKYAQAEPLYRRALEIGAKVLGETHPDYATDLDNLGGLYASQGDYAKAESLHCRAIEIYKKALDETHPDYATALDHLGFVYRSQGDYPKAEALYRQALGIRKKALGETHPMYAKSLNHLATLYQLQRDDTRAEPLRRQALEIYEKHFANTLRIQSERQQLAAAKLLRSNLDDYLSLTDSVATAVSVSEAYRHVLGWKGAVFSAQSMARRARANPELDPLFNQLTSVSTRLATLSLAVPNRKNRDVWLRQIGELTNRKEDLERDLATRSAEFRQAQESASLTPEQLQRVLPKNAALVDFLEFAAYRRPATKGQLQFEQRLVAFVVRSDRPIARVELGAVQPLVEAADHWRRSILGVEKDRSTASATRLQIPTTASTPPERLLRERLWNPLLAHLQGVDLVMISPDGFLNRIPLAALPGREPGTYLVEETQLVTVPVPRELPALLKSGGAGFSSNPSLLLVGNVDFGGDPGLVSIAQSDVALTGNQHRAAARGSGGYIFDPLPGTAAEIGDVDQLFRARFPGKEIKVFQKSAATEEAFRAEAPRHRWIHLATHGFFAPESVRSGLDTSTEDQKRVRGELFGSANDVRGFHPGLLSGIALAGANGGSHPEVGFDSSSGNEADDGVLTALEVAGLDLRNVDLVVLSACETGLGRVAGGEGVLGLQRAFQLAGAKSVMASLWKVDDRATVALMRVFYHKLWVEQKPAAAALREAQLALLRHPQQIESLATTRGPMFEKTVKLVDQGQRTPEAPASSPRYWAAFVVSGTGM